MNTRRRSVHRVVLAYSGGLNGSVAIRWLGEHARAEPVEVVTVSLDLGQQGELEEVRDRALAIGAARAHVLDVRDEFARDYVGRALKADALADDRVPMISALAAPLITRKVAEIALIEQADIVAHGASDGAGAARFEVALKALNPALEVIAPVQTWDMTRTDAIEYARTHKIAVPVTREAPHSADANLWGRVIVDGAIDGWNEPPEDLFTLTRPAPSCPSEPAYVEISFERGVPAALNGISMPLTDLIGAVAMLAGSHGVGRLEAAGTRVRDVSEAPAAVVLHAAHAELQKLVTTKDAARFSRRVSREYADVLDRGTWFSPLREALDAYVDRMQERVSGDVKIKLYKGDARIVGRKLAEAEAPAKRLRVVGAQPH
jgi:argininosuccinate synthase